ncbi:MAG: hypothetical protein RI925_102 [Pseudomonadota bacterium]|jgi:hypothetical protein
MTPNRQLYIQRAPLPERLTLGLLRQYLAPDTPQWISLEPRAWLPERNGSRLRGPLPGLAPLAERLPDGLDDLPLLAASLFEAGRWRHFHDAHPLSEQPSLCITWSLTSFAGAHCIDELHRETHRVLSWHDRQRFGLSQHNPLPDQLEVEHYHQNGKRLTWRLIPPCMEA